MSRIPLLQIIRHAHKSPYMSDVKQLFLEYSRWIEEKFGVSLSFQGFEEEMAQFPGNYAPPRGRVLLASVAGDITGVKMADAPVVDAETVRSDSQPAGCIALRPISPGTCEMKRLYVRPQHRGLRIGERLVQSLIEEARDIGYTRMVLDTFHFGMDSALNLYRSFGFEEIEPYHEVPEWLSDKIVFMGMELAE